MPVPAKIVRVYGVVQGVGFRPFASRLAERYRLTGSVANQGSHVEIHLQGPPREMELYIASLENEAPPRAAVRAIRVEDTVEPPAETFRILAGSRDSGEVFVSPDIAVCPRCEAELYDPGSRRYLHAFINCTDCGPRLTILDAMPYDRERTSMEKFPMCGRCSAEYRDPGSRRYDAQPVCCPDCGPEVYVIGSQEKGAAAIRLARETLCRSGVVAVKGIGGFHLACSGHDPEAIRRLRERKGRGAKPFAVMMADRTAVRKYCIVPPEAESILTGAKKPVVLLRKRLDADLPEALAPGNPMLGVMLPYTPLHHLLFRSDDDLDEVMSDILVMTSGNFSGAPIVRDDEGAIRELSAFCDLILSHNRAIRLRADDSVTDFFRGNPYMVRRSRGYAPLPVWRTSQDLHGEALALGGDLKNSFCLAKDGLYYLSPYIGDMGELRTEQVLQESLTKLEKLLDIHPEYAVCDLHPGYFTARFAESLGLPVVRVQHHWAHILACMAENNASGPVIGAAMDGTGCGTDGTVWGGEILHCTYSGFTRLGHPTPFLQAGGDCVPREGWRIALALLRDAFGTAEGERTAAELDIASADERSVLLQMLKSGLNTVSSTSAGRLFDGVSSLLGLADRASFEGEAAMKLQFSAMRCSCEAPDLLPENPLQPGKDGFVFATTAFFRNLATARLSGTAPETLAMAFHRGLADMITAGCIRARELTGTEICALSGGVFQNTLLLELAVSGLEKAGFRVLIHHEVPPNDNGLALGQCAGGAAKVPLRSVAATGFSAQD